MALMKMNNLNRKSKSMAIIALILVAGLPLNAMARSRARQADASHAATTSFHFSNIPVRSALQLIAQEGNFNLVLSDSVQGTITLDLDDVTWEQALEVVLRLKGLQQNVDGNMRSVIAAGG